MQKPLFFSCHIFSPHFLRCYINAVSGQYIWSKMSWVMVPMGGCWFRLILVQASPNVHLSPISNPTHCKNPGPSSEASRDLELDKRVWSLEDPWCTTYSVRPWFFFIKIFPRWFDDRPGLVTTSLAYQSVLSPRPHQELAGGANFQESPPRPTGPEILEVGTSNLNINKPQKIQVWEPLVDR